MIITSVNVKTLTDQHLSDEYRQIPRLVARFRDHGQVAVPDIVAAERPFLLTEERIRWLLGRSVEVVVEMEAREFIWKGRARPLQMPAGYDTFGPVWFPTQEDEEAGYSALMAAHHKKPSSFLFWRKPAAFYHYAPSSRPTVRP